jgi:hypothetical protein
MRLPDPESPDCSLGDCAICMDAIIVDSPTGEKGTPTSKEMPLGSAVEGRSGGILNAVHRNVVGAAGIRKSYSLAPCHHLFVSFGCRCCALSAICSRVDAFGSAHFLPRNGMLFCSIRPFVS